jgi:anti-sigma factor RsiW
LQCADIQILLHAYADGELDLVRSLEVEQHLQSCPTCAAALRSQQTLRAALGDPALYHRTPVQLRERIRTSLRPADKPRRARRAFDWWLLATAASLVLVALLGWGALRLWSVPGAEDLLAQEVVASHARFLVLDVPLGVESSDKHEVKPWLTKRVGFSPTVIDLGGQDFPLLGGRVDYLDNHLAANLVYKRHKHIINLFEWPAPDQATRAPQTLSRQTYHLIHWVEGGLTYWAVSDLNEEELQEFVRLIRGAG